MAPSIRSFASSSQAKGNPRYRGATSPTLTATTSASVLDLGQEGPSVIVNRSDLRASVGAYEGLLSSAKGYRNALISMSAASTGFAHALEECARVKGAGSSGDQLLAASGLQYLIASSGQILSDTLYRSFEIPLLHGYDTYVATVSTRHAEYEALLAEKTAAIRKTEMENMKQGRKKNRDLAQFRKALERLQEQVMEVEICKRSYYNEVLEHETETWSSISGKIALVLRSTIDLSDRLASKGSSDPVLEAMMNEHPDPFNVYENHDEPTRDIFTVLPPLGMNLGLGGSKRSSQVGTMDEGERSESPRSGSSRALRESREETVTPKAGRKASQAISVADALGFNNTPTRGGQQTTMTTGADLDARSDGTRATTPRRAPPTRLIESNHSREPSSASDVSSPRSQPAPHRSTTDPNEVSYEEDQTDLSLEPSSSPEEQPHDTEDSNIRDHPRIGSANSNSKSHHRSKRTPSSSPKKSSNGRRQANLSRVSEVDSSPADPMAGDWGAPVYGKTLSPVLNGTGGGYDSGEEETIWGGGRGGAGSRNNRA